MSMRNMQPPTPYSIPDDNCLFDLNDFVNEISHLQPSKEVSIFLYNLIAIELFLKNVLITSLLFFYQPIT